MTKRLAYVAVLAVLATAPARAVADSIVFVPVVDGGQSAGWKPVGPATGSPHTTNPGTGYWDATSYDTTSNTPVGACSAASLIQGVTCDWAGGPSHTSPSTTTGSDPLEYFGLLDNAPGTVDAPLNFYFSGSYNLDWAVISQLTAWDDTVEFGWYEAGNPDNRTAIYGGGAFKGPYVDNQNQINDTLGRASSTVAGDFGFYYRNTRFGDDGNDVLFFTESRFNQMGAYFNYFLTLPTEAFYLDDEQDFQLKLGKHIGLFQQFIVFKQGDRYWLGLEDQFGNVSPLFCDSQQTQPCADYDFNDFLLELTVTPVTVPEPLTLTLLGLGLFGVARKRARRAA